jgi:preprotein translocase subunit SecF
VGQVASKQLRNQAIAVTIAALVGMLLFIAFRFEWTYGAAAVIAVFHTVLVTLGLFSIFQIEINLTVIAALLTLVGFDVNDSIVIFDRIRENRKLYRRMNLYDVTNLSINQTLSRTVITSGLVFLSVVAMVLLGGETLRPFSLALLMGIIFGTYDTIAVAGPIMVWWEKKIAAANKVPATSARDTSLKSARGAARGERTRDGVGKPSQAA